MSANQPIPPVQVAPQPTAAVRFLFHLLGSLIAGIIAAVVVTLLNYAATDGQSIDFHIVLIASGFTTLGFIGAFIRTDVKPNQALILQGISDLLQATHQPIFTYLSQLFAMQQQIVQAVQSVPSPAPLPVHTSPLASTTAKDWTITNFPTQDVTSYARSIGAGELVPQSVPISQLPTQDMPAVVASQPWQPTDPAIHWGDTAAVPAIPQ